jgi:glycosyltransferase involved in cell wall biosynthesis
MKILHLTTHLNIGGISQYVTTLAKALKNRGHKVFVASSGGELEKVLSSEGIKHIYVNIRTKSELSPKVIGSFFALKTFLRKEKIDLIHAHTRVAQVIAALLSFWRNVPYVTTCHGFFKRRLGRRIFGCWGERAIAISEAVRNQLIHDFNVDEEKALLIHTGIEVARFIKNISQEEKSRLKRRWNLDKAFVVGTIGRLSPVKGQDVLLKAAKELAADFSDIKIVLVGGGPDEKRLRRLSKTLKLDKNVIFIPSVGDTTEILPAIDIFVFPSIKEGLGLSLMEAMASGKPCIASRVGGIKSLIEDGVTGLLVTPGDPDELARAIKCMINDANKAELFKNEARKRIIKDFDIDKMVLQIEKVYGEVIGNR